MELTWEQKFEAIQALHPLGCTEVTLHMRKPGDWYMSIPRVEIKKGPILASAGESGNGVVECVRNTWNTITNLPANEYLVINSFGDKRKAVKWNGFMWKEINEEDYK